MTPEVFFKELQRLIFLFPKRPSQILNSPETEYGNFIYYGNKLFNCFDCSRSTNCTHMYDSHFCTTCGDMDFCFESETCYECVNTFRSFNCTYLDDCVNMTDSDFSFGCRGCHDVFGCVRLNNKSFCIFNRQLTESEYHEKVKYLKTLPPEKILAEVEKIKNQFPYTQTNERENQNSSFGNYVFSCNNCYLCFDISKSENCAYLYDTSGDKNSFDVSQSINVELSNQVIDSDLIFNSSYIMFAKDCYDSMYLFDCVDVKNSLGCANIEHKQYCFLNRQYTKEEYEKITQPLIAQLKAKDYEWANLEY